MSTIFLKFTDELEATTALKSAYSMIDEEGNATFQQSSAIHSVDVVGIIQEPTGVILQNEGGEYYLEVIALDGYYVNILGYLPEALATALVDPAPVTPSRIFAIS